MESQMFFIYDHTVLQQETDVIQDAILYFFPSSLSELTRWTICGQLMGTLDFFKSFAGSAPVVFQLQHYSIVTKHLGRFTLALAGKRDDPTPVLQKQLENLYSMFTFYHNSFALVEEQCQSRQVSFSAGIQQIWDSYLPFVKRYGDNLASVFETQTSIVLPKSLAHLFLKTSFLLEWCHQQKGILKGCVIFQNKVLCSHLNPKLTGHLLILRPQQSHLPCTEKHIDLQLPHGVRILTVYLSVEEYSTLLYPGQTQPSSHAGGQITGETVTVAQQPDLAGTLEAPREVSIASYQHTPSHRNQRHAATAKSEAPQDSTAGMPGPRGTNAKVTDADSAKEIRHDSGNKGAEVQMTVVDSGHSESEVCSIVSQGKGQVNTVSSIKGGDGLLCSIIASKSLSEQAMKAQVEGFSSIPPTSSNSQQQTGVMGQDKTKDVGVLPPLVPCVERELHLESEESLRSNGTCESSASFKGPQLDAKHRAESTEKDEERSNGDSIQSPTSLDSVPSRQCSALDKGFELNSHSFSPELAHTFTFSRSTSAEDAGSPGTPGSVNLDTASLFRNVKKFAAQGNAVAEDLKLTLKDQGQSDEESEEEAAKQKKTCMQERTVNIGLPADMIEHSSGSCRVHFDVVEVRAEINRTVGSHSANEEADNGNSIQVQGAATDESCDGDQRPVTADAADMDRVSEIDEDQHHCPSVEEVASSLASPQSDEPPSSTGCTQHANGGKIFKEPIPKEKCTVESENSVAIHLSEEVSLGHGVHLMQKQMASASIPPPPPPQLPANIEDPDQSRTPVQDRVCTGTTTSVGPNVPVDVVPEAQLVKTGLYIQGNSDMMLILFVEEDACNDQQLLKSLWKTSLPQLGELDAELKQCPEAMMTTPAVKTEPSGYGYLQYDSHLKKLTGQISASGTNPMQPLSAQENEFCECSLLMHEQFAQHADIRDITLRSHTTSVYGHRTLSQEVFFHDRIHRPLPGLPKERDPTLCIDVQAYQRLWKEQATHIV